MKNWLTIVFLLYLRFWSKIALFFYSGKTIGIAGSIGKTSTKQALAVALKPFGKVMVTEGNSETGVPLGILGIKQENFDLIAWLKTAIICPFKIFNLGRVDFLIVEMGTDDLLWPKNMDYLLSVVTPEYVIWLNTSSAHLEQFGRFVKNQSSSELIEKSRLSLATEDGKIITKNNFAFAVVNNQDTFINQVLNNHFDLHKKINFFGTESCKNYLLDYQLSFPDTSYKIVIDNQEYGLTFKNQVLAKEYGENFISVLMIVKQLNLDINQSIVNLQNNWNIPNGRGVLLPAINDSWVIDSSYNASPDAFTASLQLLDAIAKQQDMRPVVVIGDMRELGSASEVAHIQLANQTAQVSNDVYCVGELSSQYLVPRLKQLNVNSHVFANSYELGMYLANNLSKNSLILVKGSQNTIFLEEAVKQLLVDKNDVKRLCRQSNYWLQVKSELLKVKLK